MCRVLCCRAEGEGALDRNSGAINDFGGAQWAMLCLARRVRHRGKTLGGAKTRTLAARADVLNKLSSVVLAFLC